MVHVWSVIRISKGIKIFKNDNFNLPKITNSVTVNKEQKPQKPMLVHVHEPVKVMSYSMGSELCDYNQRWYHAPNE